jgi:ketosteroid isomerase-like protein
MSQENVELVRRLYEVVERAMKAYFRHPRPVAAAIRDDDLDPEVREAFDLLHPDVVWNVDLIGRGTYRGRLEFAAAWDDLFETVDDYTLSVRELVDGRGERVFAAVDRTGTFKGSGIKGTFPVNVVITVRDGLIAQIDEYSDRDEALEAAGLRE